MAYIKRACIIFDDFTMDAKYVSFLLGKVFGNKEILTAKPNVNLRFMFEYLSHWELKSEEHKALYFRNIPTYQLNTLKEKLKYNSITNDFVE